MLSAYSPVIPFHRTPRSPRDRLGRPHRRRDRRRSPREADHPPRGGGGAPGPDRAARRPRRRLPHDARRGGAGRGRGDRRPGRSRRTAAGRRAGGGQGQSRGARRVHPGRLGGDPGHAGRGRPRHRRTAAGGRRGGGGPDQRARAVRVRHQRGRARHGPQPMGPGPFRGRFLGRERRRGRRGDGAARAGQRRHGFAADTRGQLRSGHPQAGPRRGAGRYRRGRLVRHVRERAAGHHRRGRPPHVRRPRGHLRAPPGGLRRPARRRLPAQPPWRVSPSPAPTRTPSWRPPGC